jgi:hypothetical protein
MNQKRFWDTGCISAALVGPGFPVVVVFVVLFDLSAASLLFTSPLSPDISRPTTIKTIAMPIVFLIESEIIGFWNTIPFEERTMISTELALKQEIISVHMIVVQGPTKLKGVVLNPP